jgi:S-DNA-T family DNA segregation ATPase FtsK/SpoIIIE
MSAVMDGLWGLGGRRERREVERNARVPLFDGLPDGAVLDVTETGPGVVTEPRVPFRHRPRRRVRPVWADDPAGHLAGTVGYLATETARGVTHPGETVGPFLATSWRGFRRAAVDATTWAWDLEMVATRRRLAHLGHIKDHATTRRAIIDTRKRRVPTWCAGWALLAGLVALAATTVAYGSWPARAACAAAATVVAVACHLNGRRPAPGRPAEPAPAKDTASGVTTDRVVSALEDASQTLKGAQTIGGVVHAGRGQFRHSKIEVSLRGATPSYEAVKVATQVAAYLGKPAGCVFIDQSPSTVEGEVLVTVLAQDPMLGAYVPSPLADPRKTANVWDDGIPLGVNPRGEPIRLQLIENNVLIGGVIGGGKTALLDTLLLGVLLDPLYDVEIWDFKGAGDLQVAEPFAVEYH